MPHQADRMRPDAARKKVAGTEDPVLAPLPHDINGILLKDREDHRTV